MIAVGIDVSKGKSTVAVLNEDGSIRVKPYEVLHTADQLRNLAKMFRTSPENAVIVLEPTGHYHYPILKVFRDASLPVCLVNPYLMKKYGDAQLRKQKQINRILYGLPGMLWKSLLPWSPTMRWIKNMRI